MPFFLEWGGLTIFQTQILQSWFSFWLFIMEIPTGVIADYFGRKYSIALGCLAVSLAALVYGSYPVYWIFLLGEFIWAVANSLVSGANEAWLYDHLKRYHHEEQAKAINGQAESVRYLGMLVAAPLGSLMAAKLGLNYPMLLSSIPFLIASVFAFLLEEPKDTDNVSESSRYLDIAKDGLGFFFKNSKIKRQTLSLLLVNSGAYYIIWFYQPLLQKQRVNLIYFGIFHAVILLIEIFISSQFKFLEKVFAGLTYQKTSAILTAIGYLIVVIWPNLWTVILAMILVAGFGLTRRVYIVSEMNADIPSNRRATILSAVTMISKFGLIFLNPIMGAMADYSLTIALFVAASLALLAIFF